MEKGGNSKAVFSLVSNGSLGAGITPRNFFGGLFEREIVHYELQGGGVFFGFLAEVRQEILPLFEVFLVVSILDQGNDLTGGGGGAPTYFPLLQMNI